MLVNPCQRTHAHSRLLHPSLPIMVVKIRLSRFGKRHQPLYNIVVAQARYAPSIRMKSLPPTHFSRTARDSKPMEVLGTYDPTPRIPLPRADEDPLVNVSQSQPDATIDGAPMPAQTSPVGKKQKRYKDLQLDTSRTKYWLGVGAQPSEPVWRLFSMVSAPGRWESGGQ